MPTLITVPTMFKALNIATESLFNSNSIAFFRKCPDCYAFECGRLAGILQCGEVYATDLNIVNDLVTALNAALAFIKNEVDLGEANARDWDDEFAVWLFRDFTDKPCSDPIERGNDSLITHLLAILADGYAGVVHCDKEEVLWTEEEWERDVKEEIGVIWEWYMAFDA